MARPLSLKQRLSALALSPSAPSSPRTSDFSPKPTTPKFRAFFNTPWVRRNSTQNPEQWEADKVATAMSRMIYQAGVDYEVRICVLLVLIRSTNFAIRRDLCKGRHLLFPTHINDCDRVVMNASALPDPKEVSYDLLLSYACPFHTEPVLFAELGLCRRVLSYLNLYGKCFFVIKSSMLNNICLAVESDYTVVFFAAGGRHTPGWNWVWKAYRSLS